MAKKITPKKTNKKVIVTQNDLMDIIQSHANIIDVIMKSNIASYDKNQINVVRNNINEIFKIKGGIYSILVESIAYTSSLFESYSVDVKNLKRDIIPVKDVFKHLTNIVNNILGVIDKIHKSDINESNILKYSKTLSKYTIILDDLVGLIKYLDAQRSYIAAHKLLIESTVSTIDSLCDLVIMTTELIDLVNSNPLTMIKVNIFEETIESIRDIIIGLLIIAPTSILLGIMAPFIIAGLGLFAILVKIMDYFIKYIAKSMKYNSVWIGLKFNLIGYIIDSLCAVLIKLVILSPVVLLAAPAMLLWLVGVWIIRRFVKLVIFTTDLIQNSFKNGGFIKIMGILALVSILILTFTFTLLSVSYISVLINWPMVFIFLGLFTAASLAMVAIVSIFGLISHILGPQGLMIVAIGAAVLIAAAGLFVIIGKLLKKIQDLNLNKTLISQSISAIFDSLWMIVTGLFTTIWDKTTANISGGGISGGILKVLAFLGGTIGFVGGALASFSFMAISLLGVGMVFWLATQLKMIQALNIDKKRVMAGVESVIDTLSLITQRLFSGEDLYNKKEKSTLGDVVIGWIANHLNTGLSVVKMLTAIPALASSLLSFTIIMFLATELRLLQSIEFNKDNITKNVGLVLDMCTYINDAVFNPKRDQNIADKKEVNAPKKKSIWSKMVSWGLPKLKGILSGISSSIFLLSALASTTFIMLMTMELKKIESEYISTNTTSSIKLNISNVIDLADYLIKKVHDDRFNYDHLPDMLDKDIFNDSVDLLHHMLEEISEFTNFTTVKARLVTDAIKNIMDTSIYLVESIFAENNVFDKYNNRAAKKRYKALIDSANFLKEYTSILSIKNILINDAVLKKTENILANGIKNISTIYNIPENVVNSRSYIKKLKLLSETGSYIEKYTDAVNSIKNAKLNPIDQSIRFIQAIDKSKLENLQTTYKMFKEMKEFSESINGNFEGLAETINEQLMPVLEELKEIMGKIPESVNNSATTISGSINTASAWSAGTATPSMMAEQVAKEQPNLSKEDVDKIVDQKMVEQSQTVNKGIETRLEELMEILQNYSNPVPVRLS